MTEAAARAQGGGVRIVGRYALYDEIASGGMATVYFGRLLGPVGFSRTVAIKRLHPQHAKDPAFRAMFIDEARLVSRVQHPNVVPTVDVISTDDELLLVMEYMQGESLARLLREAMTREEPVPLRVALAILSNVLHGLHAAHEAKSETGEPLDIVHRDVSPQNVMVSTDGVARVCDFGIARAKLRVETTEDGHIKGKISYMAPEQLAGAPVDRRADVYAAAVMLWELFCGRKLWERSDVQTSLIDKMFKNVDRPSLHREDLPDALDAIVMHGLERDANRRFATAREFALALEQYGPLAPPSEVGAWVQGIAKEALGARALKVSAYEAQAMDAIHETSAVHPSSSSLASLGDDGSVVRPTPGAVLPSMPTYPPPPAPSTPQMKSDTYPVSRGSRPDPERPSMRPSVIFEEVHKFNPMRRYMTRAAQGIALGLAIGAAAITVRAALRGRGGASGASGTSAAQPAPSPTLAALTPPGASCPAGTTLIPAGKLFMGDDEGGSLERPAHQVSISAFCMDLTEVTVARYKACSDHGDCKRAPISNDWDGMTAAEGRSYDPLCNARDPVQRGAHPMNCIGWDLAAGFCAAGGGRLPTEAEWEYAARGSDGRRYPWGDEPPNETLVNACGRECGELGKQSRLPLEPLYGKDDGWPTTAPVGSFPRGKSKFGAFDLAGNVWEWTSDWYAPYTKDLEVDPQGPAAGKYRIVRGGAWNTSSNAQLRPTVRHRDQADKRSFTIGFRCATSPR